MWNQIIRTVQICSFMIGVYLIGLYFTYIYPAFELFVWMSPLMHTLGGLVTAFTFDQFYRQCSVRWKVCIEPVGVYMMYLIAMTVCVGVAWEIYEYLHDVFFVSVWQPGVGDTLLDLVMDTVGAVLYTFFFLTIEPKKIQKRKGRSRA